MGLLGYALDITKRKAAEQGLAAPDPRRSLAHLVGICPHVGVPSATITARCQHDEAIASTSKTRVMTSLERRRQSLGSEAYAAIFEHTTDGVLFTIPDGTILAANESACALLDLTEEEICAAGRRGVADGSDPRWGLAVAERGRVGRVMAEARMRRGDGSLFEAEITSATFTTADG